MKGEDGKLKKGIDFEKLKQELLEEVIDGEESYDFTQVGKKASIIEANTPIRKTLRPCIAESKNWEITENLYIEGDNLDVLKLLQESYLNSKYISYIAYFRSWLAIANEVRTRIVSSDKIIFIPELSL